MPANTNRMDRFFKRIVFGLYCLMRKVYKACHSFTVNMSLTVEFKDEPARMVCEKFLLTNMNQKLVMVLMQNGGCRKDCFAVLK